MTNEQQKPATPASDPAPAQAPQEGQQSQSPAKPATNEPRGQPQQK